LLILPEDEVHLWFAFTGDFADPEFAARGILFPAETARMERLRRAEARSLFALSRILVRTTLSRYFPVSPEAWRFAANAYGKPLLNPPKNSFFARFSLSHTGGLAVFAVMREAEVGVDAERTDRAVDAFRLSRRFFSPEEAAHLRKLPPEGSSEGFFHLWTLKESFLKALGRGFSLPMNTFAFRLSDDRPRRISLAGDAPRIGEGWRFILIHIAGKMVVAVSASSPGRAPLKAVCRRILPSGDAADLPWEQAGLSEGMLHHPSGEDDCRA
jgi:4'-phosphopantetheinyl transferase